MNQPAHAIPKLLLDEQIWFGLASKLRSDGFDVVHVNEVGLSGATDEEVLVFATNQSRAVVSFNVRDFYQLCSEWAEKKGHFGIVVSNQISRGEIYRRLTNLLRRESNDQLRNNLIYLQDFKAEQ